METLAKLEELEQKFGENPRRYFAALANEYRKNGEFEQAIELCRAQLEQQPEHLSGRVVLGQALFDAFRYDEARTELTTAIELDPENFIALRLLGELAAQDGDQETAREFFSRARDIEPRNEQLLAALAALGPAEPPPTLAEAVARTKTAPQPVFEETTDRVTESDAVAGAAITAAEPVAAPSVERFAESAVPASTAITAAEPVAEPAPVGGVERFAESALGPSAKGAPVGGAPVGGAPVGGAPVGGAAEPPAEGPLRRERPAKVERKRKTPVQRIEGLLPTTLESEQPAEPQTGAPTEAAREIETQAATAEPRAAEPVPKQAVEPAAKRTELVLEPSESAADLVAAEFPPDEIPELVEETVAEAADEGVRSALELEKLAAEPAAEVTVQRVEELVPTAVESAVTTEPQTGARAFDGETPPEPRPMIVTETMADLYLEQGHRAEAIEVLRQLVSQRPEDERLAQRLAGLETTPAAPTVRDFFARLGSRGGVAPAPTAPATEASTGSLAAVFGEAGSTLLDPESAALIAVTMPEPAATPTDNEFENWVSRRRKP